MAIVLSMTRDEARIVLVAFEQALRDGSLYGHDLTRMGLLVEQLTDDLWG